MNVRDFTAASIALLRTAVGWQSEIARRMGVNRRTVVRWLKDGQTPEWVDDWFADKMGGTDPSVWPRDEWVIGDGVTGDGRRREYIVHVMPPRFIARIARCVEDGGTLEVAADRKSTRLNSSH